MLAPKADGSSTDNGRTPISPHWITWLPGAMFCLVKCAWGRVVSQEISTADEGDGGQVVVIGR